MANKIDRNKTKCDRYFKENRRERNKARKMATRARHLPAVTAA